MRATPPHPQRVFMQQRHSFRMRANTQSIYVDIGDNLARIGAQQHQVIFGRRGSGKSCLLMQYLNTADTKRIIPIYVLADEYKRLTYPDTLIRLLIEILEAVLNRTGFLGDLISWEDGVYGTFKSVFSGGARACRSDGRGAPGGPRISVGGAAVGGTEARLHGGDAAEVGAAGAA